MFNKIHNFVTILFMLFVTILFMLFVVLSFLALVLFPFVIRTDLFLQIFEYFLLITFLLGIVSYIMEKIK